MKSPNRHALAAALTLAVAGFAADQPIWAGETIRVAQVEIDTRPADELNDDELRARIMMLRELVKQQGDAVDGELRQLLKADREAWTERRGDTAQEKTAETQKERKKEKKQPAAEQASPEAVTTAAADEKAPDPSQPQPETAVQAQKDDAAQPAAQPAAPEPAATTATEEKAAEPAQPQPETATEQQKDDAAQPAAQPAAPEPAATAVTEEKAAESAQPQPETATQQQKDDAAQPAAQPAAPEPAATAVTEEKAPESAQPQPETATKKQKAEKKIKTEKKAPASQQAAPEPAATTATDDKAAQPVQPHAETAVEKTDDKSQEAPAQPADNQATQGDAAKPAAQQPPATDQQTQGAATAQVDPEDAAIAVLSDERPPAKLNDAELRQRMRTAGELIKSEGVPNALRRALREKRQADAVELNSRIAASTGVTVKADQLNAEVAKIIEDKRTPEELDDEALRNRITRTRAMLAMDGLDGDSLDTLTKILSTDREEIRKRVAAKEASEAAAAATTEAGKSGDAPATDAGVLDTGRLAADDRPPQDLRTEALQKRIEASREALRDQNLPADDRNRIEAMIEADRGELEGRLSERRERRKKGLSTGEKIAIAAGAGLLASAIIASRPTIAAAEAYDEELEQWLVAPPLLEVRPRYEVQDFRTQPRLRYAMPAIEVDTVRFGFGEAYLRPEEVLKLERIGGVIERILDSNPDEVFLIEGHTDAVGSNEANQILSEQRAASVRETLIEYFAIGEDNLVAVGYGESYLRIPTQAPEVENRRVTMRRITPLLRRTSTQ